MNEAVLIFGLGAHPPEDATVETLEALDTCAAVYCDLADEAQFSWFRRFFPKARRPKDPAEIVDAARKSAPVGLAVWGHPQYTSRLARKVEELCRKKKVPFRVYSANSPIGSALARSLTFLGGDEGHQGIQAYELKTLLAEPDLYLARLPAVVFAERGAAADWTSLAKKLAPLYPQGHRVRLQPSGKPQREVPLSELSGLELGGQVLIPPATLKPPRKLIHAKGPPQRG